jgi:dCTP deaminase
MNTHLDTSNGFPFSGILVDNQIRRAMEIGVLGIDPFDEHSLEPATYDLRIGKTAVVSSRTAPLDLSETPLAVLDPYAAAVLQTHEVLKLSTRLVGRVGLKTSLQRRGLIASTGPQIDPGFRGTLAVTIVNFTSRPYFFRFKEPFISIEFHALSAEPSRAYEGPYQDQTGLSSEEIQQLLTFIGPTLKDIHSALRDAEPGLKAAEALASEVPALLQSQEAVLTEVGQVRMRLIEQRFAPSLRVDMNTLDSDALVLIKPIPIVIGSSEEEFTASFFDANVNMTGDTQEEALSNLRSFIEDLFEELTAAGDGGLGPGPARQFRVLREYVRAREDSGSSC